mgnify:CR=1 FL=1
MGVISTLVQNVLPYTVGNGTPAYRTNPMTGQRYTHAELAQKATDTQQRYQVNPYIAPDKPAIYA